MSDNTTISAEQRERVGKGSARAARRAGLVPAVIYGDKKESRWHQSEHPRNYPDCSSTRYFWPASGH